MPENSKICGLAWDKPLFKFPSLQELSPVHQIHQETDTTPYILDLSFFPSQIFYPPKVLYISKVTEGKLLNTRKGNSVIM